MLTQLSLLDTDSFTSSPASVDGPLPPALPDGPMTAKSSPAPARASRSRSRAKEPELRMRGTYGPTFSESSVPAGPLSSWENRLRQRLARIGSSECELTWKVSAMTCGRLLSRLVPSTPRIVEIDSGLLLDAAYWSTPRASDGEKGGQPLPAQAFHTVCSSLWPTAVANDDNKTPGAHLAMKQRMGERDGTGSNRTAITSLQVMVKAQMWPSPTLPSGGQTWPEGTTLDGKKSQVTLNNVATALWSTPMAGTPAQNGNNDSSRRMVELARGLALAGSSPTTAKRGVLNPAFPCWLMGYPIEWVSCGASAMQSLPKSRRK